MDLKGLLFLRSFGFIDPYSFWAFLQPILDIWKSSALIFIYFTKDILLGQAGMVVPILNPSNWEAEAR